MGRGAWCTRCGASSVSARPCPKPAWACPAVWTARALGTRLGTSRLRFAERLSADCDEVRAAVSPARRGGPVGGRINRLKDLERGVYGRAKLAPLERGFPPPA